jgi:FKBP-type peptidyl-prolyl cis-trans isomerase SlyD
MNGFRRCLAVLLFLVAPSVALAQTPPATQASPAGSGPAIEKGSKVELEYTLSDDAGKVLESNKGAKPLSFVQGNQQLIPGLERELAGMHAGEQKTIVVRPEDAYGPVEPAAQVEVPKEALPAESLQLGTRLMARNAAGDARLVIVKEIKDKTVVLDLNHPFAGKTLHFDVKVLGVEAPKAPESTPTK